MIEIELDEAKIRKIRKFFRIVPKTWATVRKSALGKLRRVMKDKITEAVTAEYTIEPGRVRKAIQVSGGGAVYHIRGKRLNVVDFITMPNNIHDWKRGVPLRVAVKAGSAPKAIMRSFLMRTTRKVIAMYRYGPERENYKALLSPAIPQMLENDEVAESLQEEARQVLETEIATWLHRAEMAWGETLL